jgi:choline-sulfatase
VAVNGPDLSRRGFSKAILSGIPAAAFAQRAGRRPNILFICSDQHHAGVMGASRHPLVRTPHLDRLAGRGVLFRNAYCSNPVCAPSRAGMMTGAFPSDVGAFCNGTPFDGRVPSWGARLRDAGYHAWATGKMDLSKGRDFGFHEVATTHGHSTDPDVTSLFRAPVCFRPNERGVVDGVFEERVPPDQKLINNTLKFLREEAPKLDRPWAAYVGITKPHPRWIVLPRFREMYPPERVPLPGVPKGYFERRHPMFQVLANFKNIATPVPEERVRLARSAYFGMVTEVDELIGQLLDAVDQAGQWENTLIIYTSDHGEMLGEHGLWLKNVLLEGAAHVPLLLAGAGLPHGKAVDTAVAHVDLVATLLDVAGAPKAREHRGHSLLPLAHGNAGDDPGFAYSESHSEGNATGSLLIRKGDWKYIYFTCEQPLLFNLHDDPGEFHNLAGNPETAQKQAELHAHLTSLVDPDAVTERAFAAQQKILDSMVARMSRDEFYRYMKGRLGGMQARVLASQLYRSRA